MVRKLEFFKYHDTGQRMEYKYHAPTNNIFQLFRNVILFFLNQEKMGVIWESYKNPLIKNKTTESSGKLRQSSLKAN